MATNKLNFSAAGSNLGYKSGIGALSDRLMEFGSDLNDQEQKKLLAKEREQDRQDRLNRYAIEDQRYLEQKAEKASDKFDARQKEIATNEALALVGDEKGFLSTKTSAENKAYEDALATVEDPVEKARLANEIKQYQTSGEQAKSWKDSVLGNSNIDQKVVGDLKRELARDEESARRFNLQLAETRATRNEAAKERQEAREREEQRTRDTYGKSIADDWQKNLNIGKSGAIKTVDNVSTGKKIIDPSKKIEAEEFKANLYHSPDFKKDITEIENLNSKILTPEQKSDDKYLQEQFAKDNPKAYKTSTPLGRFTSGIDTSIKKNSELRELYSQLGNINVDPLNATPEQERLANEERNKIQSKINEVENKYSSKSSGSNISFEDYKKAKINESNEAEKNLINLQKNLESKISNIEKQVINKYGIDEKTSKETYMTPQEAGDIVYKKALREALDSGISSYAAESIASNARVNAVKDLESRAKTTQSSIDEDKKETKTSLFKIQEEKVKSISDSRKKLEENLEALKRNVKYMDEVGSKQFNKEVKELEDKIIEERNRENDEIAKLKASLK